MAKTKMAKTVRGPARAAATDETPADPFRDDVMAFIARERSAAVEAGRPVPAAITKREIARALGIKGEARIALKRVLRDLEAEGAVERRHRRFDKAGVMPSVLAVDIVGRDRDGDLIAKPSEWDSAERGVAPRIVLHIPRRGRPGPAPGIGDHALVRTEPNPEAGAGEPAFTGRLIKLLGKARVRMMGVFRDRGEAGLRLLPVDKKNAQTEFAVPVELRGEAEDGDLVAFETVGRGHALGLPVAKVIERLGSVDSERAISFIAIETHHIPHVFRADTLAEAEAVRLPAMAGREDWRALPLVTIDPPDAKDHDDAVYAEPDTAPDNTGGFVVTVAIADVAALVRPGTALDREALDRGNSVYFPDRVVPMLPERISSDLGSLRPNEDRAALAVRLTLGADGRKRHHSFHRVMMRSHAKLTYVQAQAAIDGRPDETTGPILEPILCPLWAAYGVACLARDQRGPLDLNLPERKVLLTKAGTVDRVVVPERLAAHRLIEEFMILANVAAAEMLESKRQALVYRVHEEPSVEKMNALAEFLGSLGIKIAKGQVLRPAQFNGILGRVKDTDNEHVVNEVVLRSQAQAIYAPDNAGHFGLNLMRYAHFTSPIRRYADLIVHRALIRALHVGDDGLPDMPLAELADIAQRISAAERRAMAAERDTIDRLIATFLADQVGATFAGRIAGVTRAGMFVKLAETGADGFIPISLVGQEYFRFDEAMRALVGTQTGTTFRLGDLVDVRLAEAAPLAGALRFELVGGGRRRKALGKSKNPTGLNRKPARGRVH
jgi:ribonuclease R